MEKHSYDCVVIGGGPAGATAATVLADHGRRVLVVEKDEFPRHHIGESLMPQTYHTFKRIGMLDKLLASDFPRKESVQFVSASGKESQPYFFTDRDPGEWSVTWQVTRDRFDRMMLDNAREHGAEVRLGVAGKEVLFNGDQVEGVVVNECGNERVVSTRTVIDASGLRAMLSRRVGRHEPDPRLRNGAIYAYYKGAFRDVGRNAGATMVISTSDRSAWFWSIPLAEDVTSIGIVGPPSYLFQGRGDDPARTLFDEIENCPGMSRRLASAERISQVFVTSDFSFGARRPAGNGWALVGDAFGFVDPVYSSGVMLALKSGEMAADCLHEGLEKGDLSASQLGRFVPTLADGMHRIKQLVYAFYDPNFSFPEFTGKYPQFHDHIVRVLIGDVFNEEVNEMFDVMRDFVKLPEPIRFDY